MFAKVRITANEIKKYVAESTRKILLDIKILKNQTRSIDAKVSKLERELRELKEK